MGDHPFNDHLNKYFSSIEGAWSPVTELDEIKKRQITLTRGERAVLKTFYPDIHRGAKRDNPQAVAKEFYIVNTGVRSTLSVNHPKKQGIETRLYMNHAFHVPESGAIWYIFNSPDQGVPSIGWLPSNVFLKIHEGAFDVDGMGDINKSRDVEDPSFQSEIDDVLSGVETDGRKGTRSAAIAAKAIQTADFRCEVDPSHETFVSARTRRPYMEAHHFIPIQFFAEFFVSIDIAENIVSLCPNCHRAVHHATSKRRMALLLKIFNQRADALIGAGVILDPEKLVGYYGIAD